MNLIGEHTDYTSGWALPCAIDLEVRVWLAARTDGRVRAHSRERSESVEFELEPLERRGDWSDYVRGALAAAGEAGLDRSGFDALIASRVPEGSGLSSSAALTLALLTALDERFGWSLAPRERAHLAHRVETGFVGVACGVMDPLACALGRRGHALALDCRSAEVTPIAMPGDLRLLVVHSGVARQLVAGAYGQRVRECEAALAAVRAAGRPAASLRDLGPEDLPALEGELPAPLSGRLRHVVTENARVGELAEALREGGLERCGRILDAGMRSLRDDFAVSTPELDALCAEAAAVPGIYGSRLTGAGFGGCTLHLVARDAAETAARELAARFGRRFGRRPPWWLLSAADGASTLGSGAPVP